MNHFHDVQTQDARSGRNSQRFPQNPVHRNPPGPLWPNSGPVTTKSGNRLENCGNEIKKRTITSLCEITIIFNIMKLLQIYFSFQPVLHGWCNKGCGMCYPVCGMMHIKEPLLLIRNNSLCGGSGFPLSLSVWFFTICLTLYNRK